MAVAFVGSAFNIIAPSTTITIAKPPGTVDGHLMLASFAVYTSTPVVSTLAGWTPLRNDTSGPTCRQQIFYKMASSEPASYIWSVTASADVVGSISSYSGTGTVMIDAHGATAWPVESTPISAPSLNAMKTNEMLVTFFAQGKGDQTFSTPAGMTEFFDTQTGGGGGSSGCGDYEARPAAGATGIRSTNITGGGKPGYGIGASVLIMDGVSCLPTLALMGVGCK